MDKINDYLDKGIQFHNIDYVVEIFPAPLPIDIEGRQIVTADDLLRSSRILGFNDLFIPESSEVEAESEGENLTFSREDFLRWQLESFNPQTLYYIINKIDANFTEILDWDEEYEKDEEYDPESWLSEYEPDSFQKGIHFIQRLREEAPEEFYNRLIEGILDEDYGLTSWVETDISSDINDARKYDHWDVNLAVVASGRFFPYIDADFPTNIGMDEYRLNSLYIRNYDEGDID